MCDLSSLHKILQTGHSVRLALVSASTMRCFLLVFGLLLPASPCSGLLAVAISSALGEVPAASSTAMDVSMTDLVLSETSFDNSEDGASSA